ncbi:MAG: nucleotidyltransferase family protein [Paludibacteraceae bacterium]|nr:nucleotidyltransferase family protein [Paludibacteraceae bacterium]
MKAMIFAAGLGTRLKPLTDRMPKALVPLAGKPLLQWQVEKLRDAGISDIIVNVHHFPDMIIDAIRANQGWNCNIAVSDEREMLLDTGGGLKKVKGERLKVKGEPILACNVDILSNIDLRALISAYECTGVSQLVVSKRETQRYLCFDEKDRLCGWTNIKTGEVRPNNGTWTKENTQLLAFSGMQILSPDVLAMLDTMKEDKYSLIDFYLSICEKAELKAFVPNDYRMMDVGKIDQIEEAENFAESL